MKTLNKVLTVVAMSLTLFGCAIESVPNVDEVPSDAQCVMMEGDPDNLCDTNFQVWSCETDAAGETVMPETDRACYSPETGIVCCDPFAKGKGPVCQGPEWCKE
jgi:hypothetical protein